MKLRAIADATLIQCRKRSPRQRTRSPGDAKSVSFSLVPVLLEDEVPVNEFGLPLGKFLGDIAVLEKSGALSFSVIDHPASSSHSNEEPGLHRQFSEIHWVHQLTHAICTLEHLASAAVISLCESQ
ncbi:hypothetical protein [Bradyrhizobium sp. USDA 4473]